MSSVVPRTKAASAARGEESIASMLASLMEAVRTMVACECVYVRAAAIKALIWMQSPYDSVDELKAIITGELADSSWPASLLNDIVLTLHARFKVLCLLVSFLAVVIYLVVCICMGFYEISGIEGCR